MSTTPKEIASNFYLVNLDRLEFWHVDQHAGTTPDAFDRYDFYTRKQDGRTQSIGVLLVSNIVWKFEPADHPLASHIAKLLKDVFAHVTPATVRAGPGQKGNVQRRAAVAEALAKGTPSATARDKHFEREHIEPSDGEKEKWRKAWSRVQTKLRRNSGRNRTH